MKISQILKKLCTERQQDLSNKNMQNIAALQEWCMNLAGKKLQDITINHAVQNNRQNSNCTTQRNTNCQQIPVLEANMDINEYKYSFLKKCEAVDAFKHG